MKYLFAHSKEFTLATHDDKIIHDAIRINMEHRRNVTFAMLNGIRGKLANEVSRDQELYIYLPFGKGWARYLLRRLAEMENIALVARSVFQQ